MTLKQTKGTVGKQVQYICSKTGDEGSMDCVMLVCVFNRYCSHGVLFSATLVTISTVDIVTDYNFSHNINL